MEIKEIINKIEEIKNNNIFIIRNDSVKHYDLYVNCANITIGINDITIES